MSELSGVQAFLSVKERNQKRLVQERYIKTIGQIHGDKDVNILDLSSLNIKNSIDRFSQALKIKRYIICENNTEILKKIRKERKELKGDLTYWNIKPSIHKGDALAFLEGRQKTLLTTTGIDVFNFDFCDTLSPGHRSFLLADCVKKHMANTASVIVTYSTRNKYNTQRLNLAMKDYLNLYGIKQLHQESHAYFDTCTMKSNLYVIKKEN